ncbi:MAG: acylphosphatase [Candidatus Omnitrophica bacterium]|nr:acylphosphatase [Candidatus Omnitrophota bacterium]
MKKQLHIYYSGRVQGIGFRYTIREIANSLKVCGWVKNLDDGRVEVLAEAEEGALDNFLEQVNQHFSRYIREASTDWQMDSLSAGRKDGQFRDFQVTF